MELEIKKPKPNGASAKLSAVQKPCEKMTEAIVMDGGKRGQVVKVCADPACRIHHPNTPSPQQVERERAEEQKRIEKEKLAITTRHRILATILQRVSAREALAVRSEKVIEGQLRGIYKIFVKLGSPGFVINRIAAVHATYFRGIQIVPQVEGHSATIRYIGFRKQHSIMEFAIMGFFRKALAVSGAKQVRLKFTVPIAQGGTYLELAITWQ